MDVSRLAYLILATSCCQRSTEVVGAGKKKKTTAPNEASFERLCTDDRAIIASVALWVSGSQDGDVSLNAISTYATGEHLG